MARIERVVADLYLIPLPEVLSDSMHGQMSVFEVVTVRITDSDGATGMGWSFTCGTNGAAAHANIARDLAPIMIGKDADPIEARWRENWWRLHYGGRGGSASLAISAVDIALWDLKGRKAGLPLWKLLGGFDPQVPVYAGGIDLDFPLEKLLKQTEDNLAKGFRAIKMKVGRKNLAEDVARVKAMREFLGDGFPLMVDANMKWTTDEAIRAARRFRDFDLVWLEEPMIPDDFGGYVRLVREGGLPIAQGENLHTLHEFGHLMQTGGVTFPEPDVTNCGGITVFMKVGHMAEALNLPVTSHGAHDVTVQLMAALPNRSYMEAHGFGLERFLNRKLEIRDGFATAPSDPGHGLDFDWKGLETLRA